jgi:hypothetical protein
MHSSTNELPQTVSDLPGASYPDAEPTPAELAAEIIRLALPGLPWSDLRRFTDAVQALARLAGARGSDVVGAVEQGERR